MARQLTDRLKLQGGGIMMINHPFIQKQLLLQKATTGRKTGANWPINVRPYGKRLTP